MSSTFLNDENKGDIVIYQSESGETKIDVRFQDETVWHRRSFVSCIRAARPMSVSI